MIEIKNLSFAYDNKIVLDDISTHIHQGDFYAITGPNGSGKTTLLKIIAGLIPTKDSVFINQITIKNLKIREIAKKIAYVPQNQDTTFNFSVFDTVMMGRNPYQSRWETFSEKDNHIVLDALEKTNLLHLKDRFTNQLSGGEQQRVRIARSMAQDTPILLLDEPLSNLDIVNQFEIMDILSYLNKNKKRTIIIVLHNFSIALQYVKQMMMIKEGNIIYSGNTQDVLTPKHIRELFDLSDQYLIDQQGNILKKTSDLF